MIAKNGRMKHSRILNGDDNESEDGYDSDLFENPEKASEFKCPICTCIAKDPIETEPCGHLYCRGCLQTHLKLKSVSDLNGLEDPQLCPSCRTPIQETSRSKFVERQVLKLRVKCSKYEMGCEWKGELKYLKSHLHTDCPFVSIQCKYCKTTYLRGEEKEHLSQCEQFPLLCKSCDTRIIRKEFTIHSERKCPNLKIQCPHQCGVQIIQSRVQYHLNHECRYRRVECLYASYGCKCRPRYCDLRKHLSDHQVTHLELKVIYLERLAQSTELLSISNATGIYPEISGLYQREEKPYLARPIWRHRHNGTHVVRYDDKLKGWVIDKAGFDRDIVAFRYGAYPTAVAKHKDPDHVLELEQILMSPMDEHSEEQKEVEIEMKIQTESIKMKMKMNENGIDSVDSMDVDAVERDDEKRAIDIIEPIPVMNGGSGSVLVKSKEKRGLFCDGLWHIKGSVENSRIKVRGYTEREFDLEWELRSTAAQMRRQRSGIQMKSSSNHKSIESVLELRCPYGKKMQKMDSSPYGVNNPLSKGTSRVVCDACGVTLALKTPFFHCSRKQCLKHAASGYDLCLSCAEARRQTQDMAVPSCQCGQTMVALMSFSAYCASMELSCNLCGCNVNGAIWHCPKKYHVTHQKGFDLCLECGKTQAAKRGSGGIMSWLSSAYPSGR